MKRLSLIVLIGLLLSACAPTAVPPTPPATLAKPAQMEPTQAAPVQVDPTKPAPTKSAPTKPAPPTAAPTATVPPTPAGPQTFKVGDIIQIGDSVLVVLGWSEVAGDKFSQPDAGQKFVAVDLLIVNSGAEPASISSMLQAALKDGTGQKYDTDLTASLAAKKKGIDGSLAPGERLRGTAAYQVPTDATGLQFVFDASVFGTGKVFVDLGDQPIANEPPASLPGETPQTAHALGEAVKSGAFEITVNSASEPAADKYTKPAEGYRFIVVDVTLVNQGTKAQNLSSSLQMWLKDATGQRYGDSLSATMASKGKAPNGEISVGEKIRGQVGFEVPADLTSLVFVFNGDLFGADKVEVTLP